MKSFAAGFVLALAAVPAFAAEPDGLTLPPGFHATVVADGLGNTARHMAFRDASRLYVSTERQGKDAPDVGIIALHLSGKHVADKTEHFSSIDNGTAIAVYKGALYTAPPTRSIASGSRATHWCRRPRRKSWSPTCPAARPSPSTTRAIFTSRSAAAAMSAPRPARPARPNRSAPSRAPILETRAGRVALRCRPNPARTGRDGEHYATGIRDTNALAFDHGALTW